MAYDTIISDWNGSINRDRDERAILRTIAVDLFKASVPFHPLRAARLLAVREELEGLYSRGSRDTDFVRAMFLVYNRGVISGLPMSFIHRSVDRYAARGEVQSRLDRRILRAVRLSHQRGKTAGILSSGYGYGIDRILAISGFRGHFDFRMANSFEQYRGRAVGFRLKIYKNKPQALLGALYDRNLDCRKTVYIGDSEDDEGCFEIAGYPVVAFFAPQELKQRCASRYRAFVPRDERELVSYLKSI